MAYFDYGYFKYSNKGTKKFNPKAERSKLSIKRGIINRIIANQFGKEFYDGDRLNGYGGFNYDEKLKIFLKKIIHKYNLNKNSKVLDIGCKKGFFIKDLTEMPANKSFWNRRSYPIKNCLKEIVKNQLYRIFTKINFKK